MEPLIQSIIMEVCAAIGKRLNQPVDALHWMRMTALDVSGEVLMGKSFGALKGNGEAPDYVHKLDNAYLVLALRGLAPMLCELLVMLPIKGLRDFMSASDTVYKVYSNMLPPFSRALIDDNPAPVWR
jgi:hypothetical protein